MIDIPQELTDPLADLGVFLKALGPYRDEAIVIGGMVPVMYRHLETTASTQNRLLASFDLDITLPEKLSKPGLTKRLTGSGFISGVRGSTHPPVSIFTTRDTARSANKSMWRSSPHSKALPSRGAASRNQLSHSSQASTRKHSAT